MSDDEKSISLSKSSTSSSLQKPLDSDSDKPNITVDGQKEVHLKISDQGESEEGSIVAAPNQYYPVDQDKDPKISHVPEPQKTEENSQSKCCLLI